MPAVSGHRPFRQTEPLRAAFCFVALTGLLSAPFYALVIASGHLSGAGGAYVSGLMWCPGLAALLTARLTGYSLTGWTWPRRRWLLIAYLLPLGYAATAYSLVWLSGAGHFPDASYVASSRESLGLPGLTDSAVIWVSLVLFGLTGMVQGTARALGEEIGWRGYLTPLLLERFGFLPASLLVGVIWASWHIPILVFADYRSASPLWIALPSFTVLLLGLSVILTWLRSSSDSLWPAALLHASHNLFIQRFFTPVTARTGAATDFAVDEFGVALPAVTLIIAVIVWWRHGRANAHAG